MSQSESIWDQAPDAPLIPFITKQQRAQLVNTKAELKLTGMEYEQGQYGPKFVATFIVPEGDAYSYSLASRNGKSPRDKVNKWLWDLIHKEHKTGIPVQLVKRGNAYLLDRPGSETDPDFTQDEYTQSTVGESDIPNF